MVNAPSVKCIRLSSRSSIMVGIPDSYNGYWGGGQRWQGGGKGVVEELRKISYVSCADFTQEKSWYENMFGE